MVYLGKPSRGCQNCRKRKIKCDEASPSCGQCNTSKRTCPGYLSHFDLVLRDQTQSVRRKAERKNQYKECTSARGTPTEPMVKKNGFIELTAFDTIPKLFVDSPEEVAVCTFFTQFILIPTHPDGHRGFLECLLPLYTSTRHDSLLSLSTTAVALAISGGSPLRKSDYRLGRSYFTTALGMATTVIQDSEKSVKDETLMAVLLLAFFERLTSAAEAVKFSGSHDAGALALLKHRGAKNNESEISAKLSLAVHTQVVNSAVQDPGMTKTDLLDLEQYGANLPRNTASRLTAISAQTARFRRYAEEVLKEPRSVSDGLLDTVLEMARVVDSKMQEWAASVPESWLPSAVTELDCPPDIPRDVFVYGDRIDLYEDVNISNIWNSYRMHRIMVLSIVLSCLSRKAKVTHALAMDDAQWAMTALQSIQQLTDDLCASVPFNLGTRTRGGTCDRPEAEYPYRKGSAKFSMALRQAAASLGGWYMIDPLGTAMRAPGLREGQGRWMRGQIMRIARLYNVKLPSSPSSSSPLKEIKNEQNPWRVGELGVSDQCANGMNGTLELRGDTWTWSAPCGTA